MMIKLFKTRNSWSLLIIRLSLGLTLWAHGAQKMLGSFNGLGYEHTIFYLTNHVNLPYFLALTVILIEFFGSLAIVFGIFTRIFSAAVIVLFSGIIFTHHLQAGFFMDFFGKNPPGFEGIEFDLLMISISLALMIEGAGKLSVDRWVFDRRWKQ